MTSPTDPDMADDDALQAMRRQLTRSINRSPHPSLLINWLTVADLRCAQSAKHQSRLILHAPKVLRVIRAELRKAFDLDPDGLLFTEPKPPAAAQQVDSLTDRALRLMVLPAVPINLNQFTAVSLKAEPARQLPFTPLEALRRVIALNLSARLAQVHSAYWQALVPGSWLTRQERWAALHKQQFADQAFVARQLDELSEEAMGMVQALVDAPTAEARRRAGELWASVQASELMWPGVGPRLMPIPGALHIYREGDPAGRPHVMYLPGARRNYYEYPSFAHLQCGLVALINGASFDDLWQCLPLRRRHEVCRPEDAAAPGRGVAVRGDALAYSAQAVLEGQWENELACGMSINLAQVFSARREPLEMNAARLLAYIERARRHWVGKARLGSLRRTLQDWDQHRRRKEILFASTAAHLPVNTALQQLKRYEKGLMGLLDPQDVGADTQAFDDFVVLEQRRKVHADTLHTLLHGAQLQLFDPAFWKARPVGQARRLNALIDGWTAVLRADILLLHRLQLIRAVHRDLLVDVLDTPLASKRAGSDTRVLSVLVGSADAFEPLHSVFAVTRSTALNDPQRRGPVVLCALGREGGVATFASLEALSQGIEASLDSRDGSVLWRYIERPQRNAIRERVADQTLAVRYEVIEGNPVLLALKRLMKGYLRLQRGFDGRANIFSEIRDVQLTRSLLAVELEKHLDAPVSDALIQARAQVDLVRKAAAAKHGLPSWLAEATVAQRNRFKYLQSRYLGSVLAYEERLGQRLPDLLSFARSLLIARLREDGLPPQLDIDTPLIEMPDRVDGRFCGWESGCTVGDRKEVLAPSAERSRLSLLQLALHNLDPQMMSTWWRFRYAQYLQPAWRQQLSPRYLIGMVSSLDIGGRYEALINGAFYPPDAAAHRLSDARVPELLRRALQAGIEADLHSAIQQGLTASAQRFFNTAMAARVPADLLAHGDQLQLHVVHLVGHTLQHDRYIAGILLIHDLLSQRCVVYWPSAPDARHIHEYASLQEAHEHLNRVGALPDYVSALARHVAPGWAFEAIAHHPGAVHAQAGFFQPSKLLPGAIMLQGLWRAADFVRSFNIKHLVPAARVEEIEQQLLEQIASDPLNWLTWVPTSHADAQALLYRARVLELHRQAQAHSQSGQALQRYREQRLEAQRDTRRRALLSVVVPFFSLGNQLYELLLTSRRYHRYGEARDAVDVAFGTVFLTIDLLLTFFPGPKLKPGAVANPAVRSMGAGLNRIHRASVSTLGRVAPLAPSPSRVARLKPLERFKAQGTPQEAVALKGPGEKGIYVKHGEYFMVDDTHHYPVYRRGDEAYFRLKNRQAPGVDELILTVHEPREWLLGADAPVAGPSSATLTPWPAPARAPGWRPPTAPMATHNRILQSAAPTDYWFSWRTQVPEALATSPPASGVFHVHLEPPGFPYDAIYIGSRYDTATQSGVGYYRLLHQGDHVPLSRLGFIARNEPLVSKAQVDIERWTGSALQEQPIPVSRLPSGEWQLHTPLFDGPLEPEVGRAFPGITRQSQASAIARVIELADSSRSVTASHLLNLRATLDNWLTPNPVRLGQTDDLLNLLRPTQTRGANLFIGYEGKAPGFTRVDFSSPVALAPALKAGGAQVSEARKTLQREAVRAVLEQQGFSLHEWRVRRGKILVPELVATHPHSNNLYYVTYQWFERGSVALNKRLTDRWLQAAIRSHRDSVLAATVSGAMEEQRLVRIVAGIQWPVLGNLAPSVYFVKLSPPVP
ncbi:dermonecrotic toxin domain-containing protein [Pseudomonas sp. S3E12]|uniref:dermonecrotic toxin domain-containing protein n=1 Tax=Pseudomonas sp. S3E12 TaxID=1873126 RepID=UPI00081C02DB|nr:hypothetical protein BB029_20010 [Pseudomonas sp. S3E12]